MPIITRQLSEESKNQKGAPAKKAQGKGPKESCWKAEKGATFLPGPEFNRVLGILAESWTFQDKSGIEVERIACDRSGDVEFVHIHVEKAETCSRSGEQYLWFNREANRFELIDDEALRYAIDYGFHGPEGLSFLEDDEPEENSPTYKVARHIVSWVLERRYRLNEVKEAVKKIKK